MNQRSPLRRTFLFLQGPHGSFFPKLGKALHQAGHRVRRINLNGGDRATWPSGEDFRGTDRQWQSYLGDFLDRQGVTDLILFGDNRPQHVAAIAIAKLRGVRIHVFEEGYLRPDWVTLERDGVNGHSTLPRDPSWYKARAATLVEVPTHPPLPSYGTARGWAAFFYYAEVVLQHWRFPFHRSHRARNPVWEGISYLRRFRRREQEREYTERDLARLDGAPYFLFPLQLDSDYQIRLHSRFGNMRTAIEHVLESFAATAPPTARLAIKEHPLDGGLTNWRPIVEAIAAALGIGERVAFLEQGDLLTLVQRSRGMVTVNSTSGTLALAAGVPVKALGDAIYDIPQITHQAPLDDFWNHPVAPDILTYKAFQKVLTNRCLIHGAFLSNAGIELLVATATDWLTADLTVKLLTKTREKSHL